MVWKGLVRCYGLGILGLLLCVELGGSAPAWVQKPAVRLFQVDHQQELQWKALRSNRNVRILNYDLKQYLLLKQQKPASFNLVLPGLEGQDIEVELVENKVLSEDFVLSTDKARNLEYTPGLYYSGKIKGQDQSLVVISLFENEVMGMISPAGRSNLVIGNSPVLRRNSFVLFDDGQVDAPSFNCMSNELPDWTKDLNLSQGGLRGQQSAAGCVGVFFECGLSVHDAKGGPGGAADFVSSFYNAVSTIYSREGISTNISEIKVWTTNEPYGLSSDRGLEDFSKAYPGGINGDLGHFIRLKSGTFNGLAWLDVLCKTNRYAYSEVSANFTTFPTYSWTVNVITHEMGHNLGSPHTQSCTWPGGAIDNCANPEGTCAPGPRPIDGGTIMSYCHQLTSIGINFNSGFGTHPGNRIRDRVNNAGCLSGCAGGGGTITTSPDLVISALTANPLELSSPSSTSTIQFSTANAGNATAQASKSRAYFSTDAGLSSNDLTISEADISALSAGASTNSSLTFKFPSGTNPGAYYILVCADQGGTVAESSEANNCRSLGISLLAQDPPSNPNDPPPPPNPSLIPDLTLSISSVVPPVTMPGSVFTLAGRIFNLGPGKTTSTQLGVVLSTDGIYSSNDVVLVSAPIPAMDNQGIRDFTNPVTIPSGLNAANYQLIICVDPANNNLESDESNNCKSFTLKIHIDKADLVPKDLKLTANPSPSGSPFNILFNNLNQGVLATTSFWTGVYLSKNNKTWDADDLLLGQFISSPGLAPNQSKAEQLAVSSLINPGNFTLLVCSDNQNEVSESDEVNNCAAISITITNPVPDLIIGQFVTPSEIYLGDSQTIRFTIYNQGFLQAGAFKAKVSISNTPAGVSTPLASVDIPALGSNETIETMIRISLKDLKWLGRPYFMVCADSELNIKEANESNNCRDNQTWVRETLPDLKLIGKSPAALLARGSSFKFPIILANIGRKDAPASETEIYISDKSLIKTSTAVTLAHVVLDSVNKGDTLRKELELILPGRLTAGNYYLNVCTDYQSKIKEVSETNNCQSYQIQIRNPYYDIAVEAFELTQAIIYSELPATLKLGIINSGELGVHAVGLKVFAGTAKDTIIFYTINVDTLAVNQAWDTTIAVNLPARFTDQEVLFWMQVDPSNLIQEVREDNNYIELSALIVEPLSDLAALPYTYIDSTIRSGGSFHVGLQLLNLGLAASGAFEISLWLIDTSGNKVAPDTLASLNIVRPALSPGQPDTVDVIFNLPQSIPTGEYLLSGMLDPKGQIKESEESNNEVSTRIVLQQKLPDILAVDLKLPESLSRYQTLPGVLQISNEGDWEMPALSDTLYLSKDSTLSPNDLPAGYIQTNLLGPGQIQFVDLAWRIPEEVLTGTIYLILTLDAKNRFVEHQKANNSMVLKIQVPSKKADLHLLGLQLAKGTIYPGDTLTITNYIENIGETDAPSFEVIQFLKKHPLDTQVVYRFPPSRVDGLSFGQYHELSSKVFLPDTMKTQTYYLISCLDVPGEIDELSKNNNCGQLIVTVNAKQGVSTGLNKDPLFSRLKAFPNPVSRELHVSGTLVQPQDKIDFSIRDYTGRILYRQRVRNTTTLDFALDLFHLPAGLYYFDLQCAEGSWKQTFIKL
ncbi:MAG: CARDB domain-containing protein [Saprospiraceae bacterium]|nr:CARDB domain-containing protein [Saprospiraceae bacterium]